jgi:hypothetical protein
VTILLHYRHEHDFCWERVEKWKRCAMWQATWKTKPKHKRNILSTGAGSLRDPVRMCGEQPVDKADVVDKEEAESHAGEPRNRG